MCRESHTPQYQGTGNREQETGNRKQGTGNREQETGTGNRDTSTVLSASQGTGINSGYADTD